MGFTGIPIAALDFYEDLEADNSKAFWTARKSDYDEQVKAPLIAVSDQLATNFGEYKLFRPYRDVRFSKDKTPYKTHQGVWFGESHVYLQISAEGLLLAGGYWETVSAQVARLRRAVADDVAGADLDRTLAAARRKGLEVGGETVTRVPPGFDRNHPRQDLLRHKTLTLVARPGAPDWLATPDATKKIAAIWRSMAPTVAWLDTHVGASE